jgi:GT2 family glycosyltransferase
MKNTSAAAEVTFVIVGWNNKSLLGECFDSIQSQTYRNCNIVYVDNGSGDDSVSYVKSHFSKATIIDAGENLGFAIGNNRGIAKALENKNCQYIALLNSDARVDPDWVEKLVTFAQEHPKGAAFQSPTFDYYDHAILDSRGLLMDHQGRAIQLGYREARPRLKTKRVFGVNAAAALFSRAFLEAQPFGEDYFDPDMWMYLEDVDIAARSVLMGWENWFVNQSRAYHMGSASSSGNPAFSIFMSYRNNAYVIVKNFPLGIIFKLLPGLVGTELQSIYNNARGRNYVAIKAMIKARFASLLHLRTYTAKRKILKPYVAASKQEIWRLMSDN